MFVSNVYCGLSVSLIVKDGHHAIKASNVALLFCFGCKSIIGCKGGVLSYQPTGARHRQEDYH